MEQGLIGLHVSRDYVRKGTIEQNIEAAKKEFHLKNLKVVQIFLGSPRTFKISLTELDEKSLKIFIQQNKMKVYAHAPYPLAIFSQTVKPSTLGFAKHLFNVADRAGLEGVVLHLYKYPGLRIPQGRQPACSCAHCGLASYRGWRGLGVDG